MQKRKMDTRYMATLAMFCGVLLVMGMTGIGFIPLPVIKATTMHIPVILGAVLLGPAAGAVLGAVFGLVVLLSGDAAAFLVINPLGCILTVMLKGALSGLCASLVYRLLHRTNEYAAIVAAAIVCPVVNTGVFLLGCLAFFMGYVADVAQQVGFSGSTGAFLVVGFVGLNFVFELAVNAVLSPVIVRLTRIGRKS